MDSQPARSERKNNVAVLRFDDEGAEEFRVSLLLHAALLLLLTFLMALRATDQYKLPTVTPVRLVGPSLMAMPGSGDLPKPIPASVEKSGSSTRLSKGLSGPVRRVNKVRKPGPTKSTQKFNRPDAPLGENTRPGKPRILKQDSVPTSVVQHGPVVPTARPYVSRLDAGEISPFQYEPALAQQMAPVMPGNDLGEPLTADELGEEITGPIESGARDDRSLPSGNPDSDVQEKGGAGVEIAGVESLGGGTETFEAPRVVSRVLPEYPLWARQKGVKGQVVYKVLVQPGGTVGEAAPMSSTVDSRLAVLGSQALRRWVFTPVMVNGEPRETWVRITLQFKLN